MSIQLSKEAESKLAAEIEGNLYALVHVSFCPPNIYFASKWYYTILKGVVYEISGEKLTPSGDTAFNLNTECRKVGRYNPSKKYFHSSNELTYSELKKALKL